MSKQFFKFVLVGGVCSLINVLSRVFYGLAFGYLTSIFWAFFTALTSAFLLNKWFVFEKSKYNSWVVEYMYFILVNLFGLLVTIVVTYACKNYLFLLINYNFKVETTAHTIGVIAPVFINYMGHKYLSFRTVNHE